MTSTSATPTAGPTPNDPLAKRIELEGPARLFGATLVDTVEQGSPHEYLAHVTDAAREFKRTLGAAETVLRGITFVEKTNVSSVVAALRTYGVAIFPALCDRAHLAQIEVEFDDLMARPASAAGAWEGQAAAENYKGLSFIRRTLARDRYPETMALFGSPTCEAIATAFFGGEPYELNEDILVQVTNPTRHPSSGPLHWDKQLTLKSWLYLSDCTSADGPMRIAPGSNAWLRYCREDAMFRGTAYHDIENLVPEDDLTVVSTGGPAGTFFLFVTDAAHGASPVEAGGQRKIMRGRSRPTRVKHWESWAVQKSLSHTGAAG